MLELAGYLNNDIFISPVQSAEEWVNKTRQQFITGYIGGLMLAAPLFWASAIPLPRMFLELAALGLLLFMLWQNPLADTARTSKIVLLALALLLVYPLLYLLPIPAELWSALSGTGREPYAEAMSLLGSAPVGPRLLTVSPTLTEAYWLAFLPPVAVFWGVISLSEGQRRTLAYLAVSMAVLQSLLGLMQYKAERDALVCFGANICGSSAHGTYYNYDHLAGLLEMLLPLAVGLIGANLGQSGRSRRYRESWRERWLFWISGRGHLAAVLTAGSLAMLLGLVFTRSRSGIALIMLGILLCLAVFGRRLGMANRTSSAIGTVVVIAVGLALDIGLAPVLQRFSFADPLHDSRMIIYSHALQGIGEFLPLGSGPGTFPEVFRQFQPVELGNYFINHAHNDYIEWLFEGGLVAAVLAVLLFAVYLRQWLRLAASGSRHSFRFVQFGAGLGLLLLLLHGLADFNWHVPANALYAAFLAGLFLGRPDEHGHSEHSLPGIVEAEPPRTYVLDKPSGPIHNPFNN
jgi:hypothetical protein